MRRFKWNAAALVALAAFTAGRSSTLADETSRWTWNVKAPTAGGKQFWGDEFCFHGWRVQRNVFTEHCRLLDENNKRHASGTYQSCREELDRIRAKEKLPAMKGKAVIVLHGLIRTRSAMKSMAAYLHDEGGYAVFNISYPSTRKPVAYHAANLAKIIDGLEGIEEIHLVGHSLGNLVIRHYLADQTDEANGRKPDPRIGRIVMLAPPNQGSALATRFKENPLLKAIWGVSGQEIAEWEKLAPKLATPRCEFGILAGGGKRPDKSAGEKGKGRNPLLSGDDDLVVTVDETKLPGAHDFLVVPRSHTFFMDDKDVQKYSLHFLKHGCFVSEAKRTPLDRAER
jgi:pimeloyl-ACP methyl ester carboxylesterase